MSTGISISSINRIKELAEEKKFAEALEILDTQNLDKSINPQFLRISGEIFRENKRYYDSRKYLLKAHQMSPQGTRILYELIQLYLELGYYTRAQRYYEQYKFYVAPEDTQQDYLEYLVKKAQGEDVKEIAAVLIPILERMPDDRWNFEAVLLYDKMGRKDKALEECQYILENFRDSIYVQPVIDYIDDKLDVDAHFYCYPKEEQSEDQELYGDLIAQEDAILEADHLRMYPPEARIMVEADDKDGIDAKPVKEKKKKKRSPRKKNKEEDLNITEESVDSDGEKEKQEQVQQAPDQTEKPTEKTEVQDAEKPDREDSTFDEPKMEDKMESEDAVISAEEEQQNAREAALEKILSKKVDKEKILETAKHVAQSVKEIDTAKAKSQVKNVADTLKDNVAKATGSLSDAVNTKIAANAEPIEELSDEFVDGIIESVLEPPKKTVGEVVTNEELDALIPDSLEAMSAEEIADIEAKKEEEERIELEALEASMRLEEEKKESRLRKWNRKESDHESEVVEEPVIPEEVVIQEGVTAQKIATVSFEELKAQFLADHQEEEPLETLGFMSVVQSDVDSQMKEEIPQEAEILHQMIDNKEFYSGEDSGKFESRESYEKNDFEVEDYAFDSWKTTDVADLPERMPVDEKLVVKEIYAEEPIVDFDEIIPPVESSVVEDYKEKIILEESESAIEEPLVTEPVENIVEEQMISEPIEDVAEEQMIPEPVADVVEERMIPEPVEEVTEEQQPLVDAIDEMTAVTDEEQSAEEVFESTASEQELQSDTMVMDDSMNVPENTQPGREELRVRIIIREDMIRKLSELKESRC